MARKARPQRPSSTAQAQAWDGPLGLGIERGAALSRLWRSAAAPVLLLPLGSCVVEVSGAALARPQQVDRASMMLLPAGARYRVGALGPVVELLTLTVGPQAQAGAQREYHPHVDPRTMAAIVAQVRLLPRTRWVDELAQRYLFERSVCYKHASHAAVFLETELVKEVYFLGAERIEGRTRASVVFQGSDVLSRARRWIEDHLFEPISVGALAGKLHTSEATLLRVFLRELQVTPAAYLRGRRLEEAVLHLRGGCGSVSEVAARVGYASLPAFTVAFRRQFGVSPSSVRRGGVDGVVVAAHGEPLKYEASVSTRKSAHSSRRAKKR